MSRIYLNNLNIIGTNKFGNIIYPYTLLTYVISPYLVLFWALIYLVLLFKMPLSRVLFKMVSPNTPVPMKDTGLNASYILFPLTFIS